MNLCDRYRPAAERVIFRGLAVMALAFLTPAALSSAARAQNLVVNGTFSQAVIGGVTQAAQAAEFGTTNNGFTPTQTLVGWTTAGYNFVYLPNTADTTGATGQATVKLWGPDNSGTNAALLPLCAPTTGTCTSTSGNYVAADGAYEVSAISQTINGLVAGQAYAVSFAWAGAQQSGFTGPTTDKWTVSLGTVSPTNPAQTTTVVSLLSEGASTWMNQTFDFVATGSSELLSFITTGTPTGQPPFALLANVSVTKVPEPASLTLVATGLTGMAAIARRRRKRAPTTL
ncbi:MAG TPA: PEP-CTERM sorting domain-containing protein [Rhodopila sp.]|nr:PEP-CTERM sorting domain-containing protein [Rhodopila sp.]